MEWGSHSISSKVDMIRTLIIVLGGINNVEFNGLLIPIHIVVAFIA